ncbi:TonB-dependent receptor plug domain-containing protein, partial [Fibrobacterota bacterium]
EDGSMFGYSSWDMLGYAVYLRDELSYSPVKSVTFRSGLDVMFSRYDYELDIMGATGFLASQDEQYFSVMGAYGNLEYRPISQWQITPGIRYDYYADIEEGQPSFRITSRYEYVPGLTLKGAAGTYSQFPKPWGQSTDEAWGNPDLPSTKAAQYTLGHEWKVSDLVSLEAEGYYNTQWDVPNYTDSINPETGVKYNFLPDMEARMYGLEFMLRHDRGKRFFGWISYTLSRSERRAPNAFTEGNAGVDNWDPEEWVVSEYDQTHNLQFLGSWRLFRTWEAGFRLRYVTGNPMTPLLSYTENEFEYDSDEGDYSANMGEAFSDRMGPFMQLDLRVDKKFVFNSWMLTTYLDFRNVNYFFYNSPEFYDYNYDGSKRETVGAIFLPSLGVSAQF